MATLERLVATIAGVECIDAERVRAIARAIREAGLIKTAGRGTSAAQMTIRDAANLLIAVNVADTAREAPEVVRRYQGLLVQTEHGVGEFGYELQYLLKAARFEQMAQCLEFYARYFEREALRVSDERRTDSYKIRVRFEKPIPNVSVYVEGPDGTIVIIPFSQNGKVTPNLDGHHAIMITEQTIFAVGALLDGRSIKSPAKRANSRTSYPTR